MGWTLVTREKPFITIVTQPSNHTFLNLGWCKLFYKNGGGARGGVEVEVEGCGEGNKWVDGWGKVGENRNERL